MKTVRIEEPFLAYCQPNAEVSSGDNTGQNIEKGQTQKHLIHATVE